MHVAFLEPSFPANQRQFLRGLVQSGAAVTAISERPAEAIPADLRSRLFGFEQVRSVVDEAAVRDAVRRTSTRRPVDRLEATVEAHVMAAARVREQLGIQGTSVRTAHLCRDKAAMKEAIRAAGLPCAQSARCANEAEVRAFVAAQGYPIVLTPLDAAGASGVIKVANDAELAAAMAASGVSAGKAIAVEEFLEGHEGFYDTISIGGVVAVDFVSHYFPGVLEAMRTRWISPQIVVTNRIGDPSYDELKMLGQDALRALGVQTSPTHMEWFFGPKGLKFSEIGCRPPGVGVWDLYAAANEFDIFAAWAEAIVHGRISQRPSRRFSAGMIALRPDRDGRISGCEGVEELQRRYGNNLIDVHFPPVGTATQGVEAGYMANAWVRMKHEDFDQLRAMLDWVGENVKLRAN